MKNTTLRLNFSSSLHDSPSLFPSKLLRFPVSFSVKSAVSMPRKLPPRAPDYPLSPPLQSLPTPSREPHFEFEEKMLFLDSIGIDFFSVIADHPPIVATTIADIKSIVHYMTSLNFSSIEFQRIVGMCPEILTSSVSSIVPVLTFLLREAGVSGADLKRVIHRRPRLLVCSVKNQLRPTLYFLQSIGISEVNKHTSLLSCSAEEKLIPRIEYVKNLGFSQRESVTMFRRFPQLFCYSLKENLEPKFNYFVVEMGRDLKELKEFPQYFSFSLENRIKPRHHHCMKMGVCFPLPTLLKTSEAEFLERLEVCCGSSVPLRSSPLWYVNPDINEI